MIKIQKLLENAGRTIVETCSKLLPNEQVTILTDETTIKIGSIIKTLAEDVTSKVNFLPKN